MKSMKQMQDEMLSKARWDGGYPKAVHMGLGIIALARNAEEERKLRDAKYPSRQLIAFALWLAVPIVGQFSPLAAVAVGLVGFGFYVAALGSKA